MTKTYKETDAIIKSHLPLSGKMILNDILKKLESISELEISDEPLETNGWQVDYWQNFTIHGNSYLLSGSMFYGNYQIADG